jgi:small subunit ribosomal protein S6
MRRYELMLLLRPDLEDDKLQSAVEKVTRAIVNAGGSLSKVSPWGKRRLAYEITHFREASYFLIHFDIEPSQVRGIERGLLISEEILRHLVTVIGDRADREAAEAPAAAVVEPETVYPSEDGAQPAEAAGEVAADAEPEPEGEPATDAEAVPAQPDEPEPEEEPIAAGAEAGENAERSST